MNFSYLLYTSKPDRQKLLHFGFEQKDETLILKRDLAQTEFYAKIFIKPNSAEAFIFEKATDERYTLIEVPKANGAFVCSLREKLNLLMAEIAEKCFDTTDAKQKYTNMIFDLFGVKADFPWKNDKETAVFRCANNKWFAIIMKIPLNRLGIDSEKPAYVTNLKIPQDKISELIDNKMIFEAYHMNKKHWISVLLSLNCDFDRLKELTILSFNAVNQ